MGTSQNPMWRLIALLAVLVGLGCILYGLYGLFLKRPVVPPGVPPLSEVPLLGPRQTADLWIHGIATTTTLSDVSEVSSPPPLEAPKPVVKEKPKVPGERVSPSKVVSVLKKKPAKAKKPTRSKSLPSLPEKPRERVPSAFEQLMRSRAARSQGVSFLPRGCETFYFSSFFRRTSRV